MSVRFVKVDHEQNRIPLATPMPGSRARLTSTAEPGTFHDLGYGAGS
ncbi:hypothetical protein ACWDYJ_13225 [Streptomyces sp. NPDC003042]